MTYRCNNNCRHCWLRLGENASQKKKELTLTEIRSIVDEARALGCQRWAISGGEPMLREDFSEIFDVLTRKSVTYTLNTNGT
ncbi:MAG: radical SAM protein, partial [Candidatus Aminicenantes bacterium]|nr:radical SAM protein [Candidatus Aminicenantes bacterium]